MTTALLRADGFVRVPWKNGRGTTLDMALGPMDGEEPIWRLSLADIPGDGPFSTYPELHRVFSIATGPGVVLSWPGRVERVTPGVVVEFSGGDPPHCARIDGATQALNLILKRGKAVGRLAYHRGAGALALPAAGLTLVAVFAGVATMGGVEAAAGEALRLDGPAPDALTLGDGAFVGVASVDLT